MKRENGRTHHVDLHGYHPYEKPVDGEPGWRELVEKALQQAQEEGAEFLCIIHGHGHFRRGHGIFANTNTGYLGLAVREFLRDNKDLRPWMYAKIDVSHEGSTTVRIRPKR